MSANCGGCFIKNLCIVHTKGHGIKNSSGSFNDGDIVCELCFHAVSLLCEH
jgi:hypothetical protein